MSVVDQPLVGALAGQPRQVLAAGRQLVDHALRVAVHQRAAGSALRRTAIWPPW